VIDKHDGGPFIAWAIDNQMLGVEATVTCFEPPDAPCHQETYPECNYVTWIENADGWVEHYDGPRALLNHGRIEFTWDGCVWLWHYAQGVLL